MNGFGQIFSVARYDRAYHHLFPFFTESRKLDLLSRYRDQRVAKIADFNAIRPKTAKNGIFG